LWRQFRQLTVSPPCGLPFLSSHLFPVAQIFICFSRYLKSFQLFSAQRQAAFVAAIPAARGLPSLWAAIFILAPVSRSPDSFGLHAARAPCGNASYHKACGFMALKDELLL